MRFNWIQVSSCTFLTATLLACGGGGASTGGGGSIPSSVGSVSFNIVGAAQEPVNRVANGVSISGIAGAAFTGFRITDYVTQPIVFSSAEDGVNRIYAMTQTSGLRTRMLFPYYTIPQNNPVVAPDGKRVYFSTLIGGVSRIAYIDVGNPDNYSLIPQPQTGSSDTSPSVSPDGTFIVFASEKDGARQLWAYIFELSGSVPLTSPTAGVLDDNPCVSPDNEFIFFQSNRSGNNEIYSVPLQSVDVVRLTNNTADDIEPAVSPNGLYVTWSSNRSGNYDLYRMVSLNGVLPTRLTTESSNERDPAYSFDGNKIAFTSDRDDLAAPITTEIYTMATNGTSQTRIAVDSSYNQLSPSIANAWSPNINRYFLSTAAGLIVAQNNGAFSSLLAFDTLDQSVAVRGASRIVSDTLTSSTVSSIFYTIKSEQEIGALRFTRPGVSLVPTVVTATFPSGTTNALVTYSTTGTSAGQVMSIMPYAANRAGVKKTEAGGIVTFEGSFLGLLDDEGKNLAANGTSEVKIDGATGRIISHR